MPRTAGYFYPRSPCGERPKCRPFCTSRCHFYPRSPCGERLTPCCNTATRRPISIHALLAESDLATSEARPAQAYFYPRSPCGERLRLGFAPAQQQAISIHALLAESDHIQRNCPRIDRRISIHALLAESDTLGATKADAAFLSTPSHRE